MVKIELNQGLIGFFDILGYQQMLLNNEVEKTAHLIVDVLANTPSNILEALMMDTGQEYDEQLRTIQLQTDMYREILEKEVGWLLFSDSILVSLPIAPTDGMPFYGLRWAAFLYACAFLQRQLFDKGLPLRGAIAYGEFYIQDTYFAGQPIIESYQASESLELSGCVLTRSAEKLFLDFKQFIVENQFDPVLSMLNQMCVPYLVPKKRERLEKQIMINWVNLPLEYFKNLPTDIREYVFSSFVDYNKDAAPIVYPKINNTETFIRKILRNVESKPWPVSDKNMDAYMQKVLKERGINY
ncbi:MAG: hypothetical protein ACXADX_21050 [Candidatus Hodarchaeales archaeon]|jgi:hypothetical protein